MRDDDVPGPKPRSQWTVDENTAVIYNAKALNAMFTSVDMNMFNLIGTCTCARDAWEKLKTHCEGSASVKKTRMRLITSKFEKMRMKESETIMEYNGRLKSLTNEASVLGDAISNERLVSKVLRSVPKRFHTKEVKESDLEENSIALISKKFTDYLKVMKEKKDVKGAQPSKFSKLPTSEKPQKPAATRGSRQRYEGNVRDMTTMLMNAQIAFGKINPLGVGSGVAIPGRNTVQKSVCFVASNLDNSSNHEKQRNQLNTTLAKENTELKAAVARLEVLISKKDLELGLLNSELEREKTTLDKFNSSSSKLDSIFTMSKNDKFGIGFKESVFETGLKDHLTDYVEQNGGRVTYGGGAKGRIVGKGTLNVEGFPKLHNVLHVEGLNANLISINLLCDDDLHVKFDKNICEVFDNTNRCVITGTRSVDNCYQLGEELTCRHSKVDEFSLWHQKLGHVNFKTLKNLSNFKAVRSLPNLKSGVPYVCGKIAEDNIEGLLEIPHEEHSVVPDVATPNTTLVSPETVHEENSQNIEEAEMITEKEISSKIQKNNPSSHII
ncbi:uncharacterized protein [Henckelia pumila]|uniref:uncharacterized protein n=1 Tax=Henckelia pumila TaxID=405737 RepID=UPI003C6DD276